MQLIASRPGQDLYLLGRDSDDAVLVDHDLMEASFVSIGQALSQGYWEEPNLTEKHLSGQHNQQSHAGGRGGNRDIEAEIRTARSAVYARMREARASGDYSGISQLRARVRDLERERDSGASGGGGSTSSAPQEAVAVEPPKVEEAKPAPSKSPTAEDTSDARRFIEQDFIFNEEMTGKVLATNPDGSLDVKMRRHVDVSYDPADLYITGKIKIKPGSEETLADVRSILGRDDAELSDIAAMVGAPDGSTVRISVPESMLGPGTTINVSVRHPLYKEPQKRSIFKDWDGSLTISNDLFVLKDDAPKGTGTSIFNQQVRAASRQGISKINTFGARGANYNGYYTWPRLGYDTDLDASDFELMDRYAPNLRRNNPRRVSDIMKTPEGRAWYKQYSQGRSYDFDLSDGSLSRYILDAYINEKMSNG